MSRIIDAPQGSPAWHKHRATHYNASDAPAMMGVSSYNSRSDLLREKKTGLVAEVDAPTQKRFDKGHEYEAMARPWAEDIIGEELYPVVLADDEEGLPLSASLDGLTMDDATAFEHKTLNNELREALDAGTIPQAHRIQMEQQMLVSGAARCLFMASAGDHEQIRHAWYEPDAELLGRVLRGWQQFDKDLANYEPPATEKPVTGTAPSALPALRIELSGAVAESNLEEFRDHAIAVFDGISTDLQTDEDFADAEETVKWCKRVEQKLGAAKEHALSQTEDIDRLFKAIDDITEQARRKRLDLDKLVKSMKEQRKGEILGAAERDYDAHLLDIENDLDRLSTWTLAFPTPNPAIAQAMKGKRTLATLRDAAETAVANAKIDADRIARGIRANLELLKTEAADYDTLFPDGGRLAVSKSADDLHNTIKARIAEHEERVRQRVAQNAEIARRRAEENAKRDQQREAAQESAAAPPAAPERAQPKSASAPPPITPVPEEPPSDDKIIECVADAFNVDHATARDWIAGMALSEIA